ncbi:MAG: type II toxin-antitoxin system RelE/ParE family toxin [Rhizobiaceae bacterium]|nr:type II toxin-antitoxin system RelE/ParE family toxin [Rhizobiaceae bacterium]
MRIEWHPGAVEDLEKLGRPTQMRIRKVPAELEGVEDARARLMPYAGALKGYWKLRVGDIRLVCQLRGRAGQIVLIIHVAHRSAVYGRRGQKSIIRRGES